MQMLSMARALVFLLYTTLLAARPQPRMAAAMALIVQKAAMGQALVMVLRRQGGMTATTSLPTGVCLPADTSQVRGITYQWMQWRKACTMSETRA
jgi:hypothetical protein